MVVDQIALEHKLNSILIKAWENEIDLKGIILSKDYKEEIENINGKTGISFSNQIGKFGTLKIEYI